MKGEKEAWLVRGRDRWPEDGDQIMGIFTSEEEARSFARLLRKCRDAEFRGVISENYQMQGLWLRYCVEKAPLNPRVPRFARVGE